MAKSHIQIAVRDEAAIVGFFKPQIDKPSTQVLPSGEMKTVERKFNSPPRTRKELLAMHRHFVNMIKSMSSKELLQTMIDAGIYTRSGKLTQRYGG